MGYIQDFEKEFRAVLDEGDTEKTVKFAKGKILESYNNGKSAKEVEADEKSKKN